MLEFLSIGLALGFSAGMSPGPLTFLVISESLNHGFKQGFKVALAPLFTDIPIVTVCFLIISRLPNSNTMLFILSIAGGLYVFYLGTKSLRIKPVDSDTTEIPQSWRKGIITNFLSPNPYMFWLTIGSSTLLKGMAVNIWAPVTFLATFYVLLIGVKISIAAIVAKSAQFLKSKWYIIINRILGFILIILAGLLFNQSLTFLKNM